MTFLSEGKRVSWKRARRTETNRQWGKRERAARQTPVCTVVILMAVFANLAWTQITVTAQPAAAMLEAEGSVTFSAQVSGAQTGESRNVLWTVNDVQVSTRANLLYSPLEDPTDVALLLKATSVADPTKFAAVPVIRLQKSERAQVNFPQALTYHADVGRIYVASLVARGTAIDSQIIEVAPDGGQTLITTLESEVVDKLLPYRTATGVSHLLAVGFFTGTVYAVNLGNRTSRRVVGGLTTPTSAGFDPGSGNLFIAEQNVRRISVVSRSALEFAIGGTSTAPFQALPLAITDVSSISFLVERNGSTVSLLAATTGGALYQINFSENTFDVVATGLQRAQEILVLQSSGLGLPFVFIGNPSSNNLDGSGRITGLVPPGSNQPFGPQYDVASGLDSPTDLTFLPAGNAYTNAGRPAIAATNSSATGSRGRVVLWEIESLSPTAFYSYADRANASIRLLSPAEGAVVRPGAPLEIRWTYSEANSLNSEYAPFPGGGVRISTSTDGGSSFSSAGPLYLPSGPEGNEYHMTWYVPADLAGLSVRLRVETGSPGGRTLTSTSEAFLNVLPKASAFSSPLQVEPNFAVAGQNASVAISGLNFEPGAGVAIGGAAFVNPPTEVSSSKLAVNLTAGTDVPAAGQPVSVCNTAESCATLEEAFFILPQSGPRITAIEPKSGSPGTTVLLTGDNFSGIAENNRVVFGSRVGTVSAAEPTRLLVQVPFGERGKVRVRVETNGVASNSADFLVAGLGPTVPIVGQDGIVSGGSFFLGTTPLAAGSIASVFGVNMAPGILGASAIPLPRELLFTTVLIGGIACPVYYAQPNQINVQLPEELSGLNSAAATVVFAGTPGNTVFLNLARHSPGIFSVESNGRGLGAILNQSGIPNGPVNPERIGNVVSIFATGLGETVPAVATGTGALIDPLSRSVGIPQAIIDGVPAEVEFSGRSPGFVGLDQVNVRIPPGVATNTAVQVILATPSGPSNAVELYVAP